ncbi:hypothetical protein JW935_22545 [candidate division KSB1 bacterium]|nr:hypothetical protein [candidate division KSB1 bacterium]
MDDKSTGKKSGRIKLYKFSNRYLKYAFILAAHYARKSDLEFLKNKHGMQNPGVYREPVHVR